MENDNSENSYLLSSVLLVEICFEHGIISMKQIRYLIILMWITKIFFLFYAFLNFSIIIYSKTN